MTITQIVGKLQESLVMKKIELTPEILEVVILVGLEIK
tara:strand:- start:581 stop:694 length:114 start_codon:yes stop_codon:yes gene_type:complete